MRDSGRILTDRSGAAALEFALLGLPFILLLLGLIEFGRGLHIRNALDAAADRAQRVIMIDPATDTSTLESAIRDAFHAGPPDELSVTYATETVAGHDYKLISLNYKMQLLLPAPLGRSLVVGLTRRVTLHD